MTQKEKSEKLKELKEEAEGLEYQIDCIEDEIYDLEENKRKCKGKLDDIYDEIDKLENTEPESVEFINDNYIPNPNQLKLDFDGSK